MATFCIVGAGGFGLMTALHLRETYKDANIMIFDINKSLSSTINGGNGMLNYTMDIPIKDIINEFNIDLLNLPDKFEFYMIHFINYIFNNNENRQIITKISSNTTNNECNKSDYYPNNYWDILMKKIIDNNINIINRTEIIDYKYNNNKIIIIDNNNKEYECDKLILCTAGKLNLIKQKKYHKYIEIFSGYSSIIEVKNVPKCFYYKNSIFITPYSNNEIKITFKLKAASSNGNYFIKPNHIEYNELYKYIQNNVEIKKLGLIEIKNIWRGSRAMSYDILPFIEEVDKNVFWLSGGSYMGTHMANNFGKWMVEFINNKPFTNLPSYNKKLFNPKLERLKIIKRTYYIRFYIIIIFITIGLIIYKNKN